jgi:hypothetical protein
MLRYHLSGSALLLALVFSSCWGCTRDTLRKDSAAPGLLQQTSHWVTLEVSWRKKTEKLSRQSKDWPRRYLDALVNLLEQAPDEQFAAELERVRSSKSDYALMSDYDQTLLVALTVKLLDQKMTDKIVYLLSGKCPRTIATVPIEKYFAIKSLDNLVLLFDSYQTAISEDAKRTNFKALAAAFRNLHKRNEDEDQFIARARQWFVGNQSSLKVNPYYAPNGLSKSTRDFFLINKP